MEQFSCVVVVCFVVISSGLLTCYTFGSSFRTLAVILKTRVIYLSMCCFQSMLCCFRQTIPFVCLRSMCVQLSMTNMFLCACARVCVFTPDLANLFILFFKFSLSTCFSVCSRPFQHGLYKCTCTQHTVAHCILS